MTYAGLKSMLYAGVGPDDPRVKAAAKWVSEHYDLKSNPGLGTAGLFYYYNAFGKAIEASQLDHILAADAKHDWRTDLVEELAKRQGDDGAWVNSNRQWFENDKNLCTSFALLALTHCKAADEPSAK